MSSVFWNERDLERVIKSFNPSTFLRLPPSIFDKTGDLRYCNAEPLKLTRGGWDYYTPYKDWIRYGLNVDKFGCSSTQWLACDGVVGEWAVGFHGFRRDVLDTVNRIATEGFKVFQGQNSEWGTTSPDIGRNASLFEQKICGKGVFLTPNMKYLTKNIEDCRLLKPIQCNKHYYIEVALQCRIRPEKIRVPECAANQYYIVNDPVNIRAYGLCVRFMTEADAKSILDTNNFSLAPAVPFVR